MACPIHADMVCTVLLWLISAAFDGALVLKIGQADGRTIAAEGAADGGHQPRTELSMDGEQDRRDEHALQNDQAAT